LPDSWRLTYPGTELAFGALGSGYVFPTAPELGAPELSTDDTGRPRGDGVTFGADSRSGTTITFAIDVDGENEAEARQLLGPLAAAWRGDAVRSTPGATAQLTAHTGRSTFGRPRRFVANLEGLPAGLVVVTADFATADDLWYGDEESGSVQLVPAPSGGLLAPLAAPLSTTQTSDRSTVIRVDGELPTWPVFEVAGPITNPVVEIVGQLRMEFRLTLAYDQRLVIDTSPWARSILRNGASVAGTLSPSSSRLSRAALPPGEHEIVLRGSSSLGTASLAARWRPAFHTP
jgi:hypothetical protein